MKSKSTAYLLLFILGIFGGHKFYLNKIGIGILYACTGGLFFCGVVWDLFFLGSEVDSYNLLHNQLNFHSSQNVNKNTNNIVINNVPAPTTHSSIMEELQKLAKLKESGLLTDAEFEQQKQKLLK